MASVFFRFVQRIPIGWNALKPNKRATKCVTEKLHMRRLHVFTTIVLFWRRIWPVGGIKWRTVFIHEHVLVNQKVSSQNKSIAAITQLQSTNNHSTLLSVIALESNLEKHDSATSLTHSISTHINKKIYQYPYWSKFKPCRSEAFEAGRPTEGQT